MLFQYAKDLGDTKPTWVHSEHIKSYCVDSGVDHSEFAAAIEYMTGKSPEQRKFLLAKLKKNLNTRGHR